MSYSEIERMDYDEYLELINYVANINEYINQQHSKNNFK